MYSDNIFSNIKPLKKRGALVKQLGQSYITKNKLAILHGWNESNRNWFLLEILTDIEFYFK